MIFSNRVMGERGKAVEGHWCAAETESALAAILRFLEKEELESALGRSVCGGEVANEVDEFFVVAESLRSGAAWGRWDECGAQVGDKQCGVAVRGEGF